MWFFKGQHSVLMGVMLIAVYPDKGTVCFSAGLHGWAFTLTVFAKLYAKKVGSAPFAVCTGTHPCMPSRVCELTSQVPRCDIASFGSPVMCSSAWLRTR